jgi:hypothetical protein
MAIGERDWNGSYLYIQSFLPPFLCYQLLATHDTLFYFKNERKKKLTVVILIGHRSRFWGSLSAQLFDWLVGV